MAKKTKKKVTKILKKRELISLMAEKSGLTQVQTEKAVEGIIAVIKESLAKGDSVSLVNFGSFKTAERKARVGRNPQTGKTLKIRAKTVPKFVPGKGLKEAVDK